MGTGTASGEGRAREAERAINSPLLDIDLSGAKGLLVNINWTRSIWVVL